jgi:hypothetical protein
MKRNSSSASNVQRLSWRQWAAVALIAAAVLFVFPALWRMHERFESTADFRMPRELNNDYWAFRNWSRQAVRRHKIIVLGDSVIWGEYVAPSDTLSSHLDRAAGNAAAFANLGLGGGHPLALQGLAKHYLDVKDTPVILQLNPLWMSSPRTELRGEEDGEPDEHGGINHPHLIPQFDRRITRYDAGFDSRFAVFLRHHVPMLQLVGHWRSLSFENHTFPSWTIQNPYANPISRISLEIPSPGRAPSSRPVEWQKAGFRRQDYPWTSPEDSLQWEAFRRTAKTLQKRNNRLFVLIGPLNLHMLTPTSLERYKHVQERWIQWLEECSIPFATPSTLPSDLYCDASHPAAEGYRMLAAKLLRDDTFRKWLKHSTIPNLPQDARPDLSCLPRQP